MTVLRLNTDERFFSRRQGGYSVFLSRKSRYIPATRRNVIAEKKSPLPAFSTEGVRWDILVVVLSLVLALLLCILIADLYAVFAGGTRIGRLSSGITLLEENNSLLRDRLSGATGQPFMLRHADTEEPERIIILSPTPAE